MSCLISYSISPFKEEYKKIDTVIYLYPLKILKIANMVSELNVGKFLKLNTYQFYK